VLIPAVCAIMGPAQSGSAGDPSARAGNKAQVQAKTMIMTVTSHASASEGGRLRPMDPARDLKAITELIAAGFAQRLDARAEATLRELRWMARLWPLLGWWAQADPAFREAFSGFVWEEPVAQGKKSQVVGNVSLNRAPGNREQRIICNVVVREDYQRRGIARKLVMAALEEAERQGAAGVLLQVYDDNQPALCIYTDLGFREVAGEIDMQLDAVRPVAVLDARDYHFRPWKAGDGPATQSLAHEAKSQPLQWLRPRPASAYDPSWGVRLGERWRALLSGQQTYRLVALHGERLVALLTLRTTSQSGHHHLEVLVRPDHRGPLEAALVSRVLHMLSIAAPRPVETTVDKDHKTLVETLQSYGFKAQSTLLTLQRPWQTGEA